MARNKGYVKLGSNRDRVLQFLEAGPASIGGIGKALELSPQRVHSALVFLHSIEKIHIVGWGISANSRTVPIYKLGKGVDVPRPAPVPNALVCQTYAAKRSWGRTPAEVSKTVARRRAELERYHTKVLEQLEKQLATLRERIADAKSKRQVDLDALEEAGRKAGADIHVVDDYRRQRGTADVFSLAGQLSAAQL